MERRLDTLEIVDLISFELEIEAPTKPNELAIECLWVLQEITDTDVMDGGIRHLLCKTGSAKEKGQQRAPKEEDEGEGPHTVYVMLTSVYVPYTCRSASQISPTVA